MILFSFSFSMCTEPNIRAESNRVRIDISPGLTEYYVPECCSDLKPYIGKKFCSLEDGIQFYKCYASDCGFDIRRGPVKRASSDDTVIRRYIYCNHEGVKNAKSDKIEGDSEVIKIKRRRVSRRVSCKARLVLKYGGSDGYFVDEFIERHNHNMVSKSFRPFMKVNRNLGIRHQNFILDCARANIGPIKSYRLFKEQVGSYSSVGCTGTTDFKNFSRDLRAYVNGVDAQLMLDKLFSKNEVCSAFTFDYCVDEHDKLTRLFWADPISRKNYFAFGHAVTFDSTYETNK